MVPRCIACLTAHFGALHGTCLVRVREIEVSNISPFPSLLCLSFAIRYSLPISQEFSHADSRREENPDGVSEQRKGCGDFSAAAGESGPIRCAGLPADSLLSIIICTEISRFSTDTVQRLAKRLVRGCEKFVPALAYLFCLALHGSCLVRFAYFLADLCSI